MSFDFTVQEPIQEAKEQQITKDNLTERWSQQSRHGDKGNSQKERQPQGQQLHRAEGRSAVATIKGSSPRLTNADSPGTAKTTQRKRRRKAKRRSETSGEQQNVNTLKQATEASGDREAAAIHPGEGQGKFAEAPQSEAHDSAAHAASAAGDVLQVRRGELGPSLQPALLHPGSPARQPYPVGQTVQLGSADSLAFLMGLGLSTQAASDTLSRTLSSASDGRAGVQFRRISAWQMEAVCRSLVEYNIRVRDLGQLFVTCPALLTCRAEDIHQRVEDISQMLGAPTSKITKESCLANLISGAPGILADPDAMRRLQFLVGHVQRIGKSLPEECSGTLWAMAYKCPKVFAVDSVDVLQSIRFLTLQLQVDSKGTLLLVASHPEILITGIAEAFEALLAVLPLQKAELKAVIRKHPITLGVDVERAGSVLKALRAGGMEDAEVVQLVQKFPAVLSTRPKDVQVRLAFLTKLLGVPAGSILGAPSLFFNRSVVSTIGPRFSFIKDCLPDSTATWAPTTLLRSSDEDFCELTEAPLEQYAIYKKQWQEANGRRFRAK